MFCNAIFGLFCIALPIGNTTANMDNMGFGGAVGVTAPGWNANLGMGTDMFVPLNPAKLSKFCKDGTCVAYWRHCTAAQNKRIACDFSFDEGYTSIGASIFADTQDDMDRALASIGYLPDRTKPDGALTLSQLTVESKSDSVPECLYGPSTPPDEGCPSRQPSPAR
jgi:hypothetical protein